MSCKPKLNVTQPTRQQLHIYTAPVPNYMSFWLFLSSSLLLCFYIYAMSQIHGQKNIYLDQRTKTTYNSERLEQYRSKKIYSILEMFPILGTSNLLIIATFFFVSIMGGPKPDQGFLFQILYNQQRRTYAGSYFEKIPTNKIFYIYKKIQFTANL